MALQYPNEWIFGKAPSELSVSRELRNDVVKLIRKSASRHSSPKLAYEAAKSVLLAMDGSESYTSSSESYAAYDMESALDALTDSVPEFIDGVWQTFEALQNEGLPVPGLQYFNALLHEHRIPYRVNPPLLQEVSIAQDGPSPAETGHASPTPPTSSRSYRLIRKLGFGGFGVVHEAEVDGQMKGFRVALKILDPLPFNNEEARSKKRFEREVAALQKLNHRGIVQYLDAGRRPDDKPFVVMEYVHGPTLDGFWPTATVKQRLDVFALILEAVAYAHTLGVLHRDLKPKNVLVRMSDQQPVVVDFGMTYLLDGDFESVTTKMAGSVGYIPPEVQANPRLRTEKHDIYSCGVLLYEMLAGFRPDPTDIVPLANTNALLSSLDAVVAEALAPAHSRFESVSNFLQAFEAARGQRVAPRNEDPLTHTARAVLTRIANQSTLEEPDRLWSLTQHFKGKVEPFVIKAALDDLVDMALIRIEAVEEFDFNEIRRVQRYHPTKNGIAVLLAVQSAD